MNRAEFCQAIADDLDMPITSSDRMLRSFEGVLSAALSRGDPVELRGGLGRFDTVKVRAHLGRNPATGEEVKIPEKRKIRFRPGAGLRAAMGNPR